MDSSFIPELLFNISDIGSVLLCGLGLGLARYRKDFPSWRRLTLFVASLMVFTPILFPGLTVHSILGTAIVFSVIMAYLFVIGHVVQLILDS